MEAEAVSLWRQGLVHCWGLRHAQGPSTEQARCRCSISAVFLLFVLRSFSPSSSFPLASVLYIDYARVAWGEDATVYDLSFACQEKKLGTWRTHFSLWYCLWNIFTSSEQHACSSLPFCLRCAQRKHFSAIQQDQAGSRRIKKKCVN